MRCVVLASVDLGLAQPHLVLQHCKRIIDDGNLINSIQLNVKSLIKVTIQLQ